MKNFVLVIGICVFVLGFGMSSCNLKGSTKPVENISEVAANADNSKNSLDWEGTYSGVVPCADCQGIFTKITLNTDNTFSIQTEYQGKEGSAETIEGTFEWNEAGGNITMNGLSERSMPSVYKVGENKLIQLDMEGNVITGDLASNYELTKIDENLVGKKWKLIEINGVSLSSMNPIPTVEAFIIFNADGNRTNGNSGCNNFTGMYKQEGSALTFSGVVSTRKMCIDMTIEDQMNKIFEAVDKYSIADNILSLNQADAALAKFVFSE